MNRLSKIASNGTFNVSNILSKTNSMELGSALEKTSLQKLTRNSVFACRSFSSSNNSHKSSPRINVSTSKTASPTVTTSSNVVQKKEPQFDGVVKALASLSMKEANSIQEQLESQHGFGVTHSKKWLEDSKYKVVADREDDENVVTLEKNDDAFKVKVTFSRFEDDEELAGGDENANEMQEGEEGSYNEGENEGNYDEEGAAGVEEGESKVKPILFQAEIVFKDKSNGDTKGTMTVHGELATDSRLYVNQFSAVPKSATENQEEKMPALALFDRLNQDIQDRIYDLLDEIGIDDRMGEFVRHHTQVSEDLETIETLTNLNKLLS